ncbi:hypothetical protein ACQUW5_06580 [Legionella sp. CNM-1927-20]|uniref:hypothetical protein n=1 Tax=Legionella sp. CNM-1927-20 TaxID=3422221 RepID=UPI00403AAFCF
MKQIFYSVILFLSGLISPDDVLAEDFCSKALNELKDKDSSLISVIKINTTKDTLYSTTVKTSTDCQNFQPFISVKKPDAIKTTGGLCAVLPADEIEPGLCSLQITLCIAQNNCQTFTIKLESNGKHYTAATPAYYEMTFC